MGRQYQRRGTVGENQHWQRDCFEKSHNYCRRGDRISELNIHLEDTVSTKTVRRELHKSNIHGRAAIAKFLITESNAQVCKWWCQTTGNARVLWSDESSFKMFRTSGRVYVRRTFKEAYNPEWLVPTVKHGGGSVMVWAGISGILLVPLSSFPTELLEGNT
jgi:hypothetical protein